MIKLKQRLSITVLYTNVNDMSAKNQEMKEWGRENAASEGRSDLQSKLDEKFK